MAFKLLSEPIQRYVYDKGWKALRPIQSMAISRIIETKQNYILASRTASGKTEAAFLPILSKANFSTRSVQVLYISPLIALINDQFSRIEDLCKYLDVTVTKWHGEAKKSLKTRLIKNPNGVVLITPESLEAMFVNAPYNIPALFNSLEYIVIDEIHAFLGVDRGLQLMSILSRIRQKSETKIITIGLSATIGTKNYLEAKRLIGDIENTKVLRDKTKKETIAKFKFFECGTRDLSLDLLKDLYKETFAYKVLIFPNSRGRAEEVAVKLRKISDRTNGHKNYFSHHSSVDKEIREDIEYFAKNNERFNFCIACTSTLELGIDLGTVDKIVQIDSTHSVASLVQRIGRSGRREGEKSLVNVYATDKWSLLQSLACWKLYTEDFMEPIKTAEKPYDILLHQLLSIVKELSGCTRKALLQRISTNSTFQSIPEQDINKLIDKFIELDYIELIDRELILGIEGEKIVNTREFYSVFKTPSFLKVIHKGNKIGEVPFSPQIKFDQNILLAAKIWKIIDVDIKSMKINVKPAKDGKKPIFFGGAGNIHPRIREEMLRILKSEAIYEELDGNSTNVIHELRYDFRTFNIKNFVYDRPFIEKDRSILVYTFTGSKINKSLEFLLNMIGIEVNLNEHESSAEIKVDKHAFQDLSKKIKEKHHLLDEYIISDLGENNSLIDFSKWGSFLPAEYQCKIIKERLFDFEEALNFIDKINLIEASQ